MSEQHHCGLSVVVIRSDFVRIVSSLNARAGIPATTAAAEYPGDRTKHDPVQTSASTFTDETVEGRVRNAVQAGQQQGHVVVVEYT